MQPCQEFPAASHGLTFLACKNVEQCVSGSDDDCLWAVCRNTQGFDDEIGNHTKEVFRISSCNDIASLSGFGWLGSTSCVAGSSHYTSIY